jgi:hypothetical protein
MSSCTSEVGWRVATNPKDHPVSEYEFDVLIGADGKRNTLDGMFGFFDNFEWSAFAGVDFETYWLHF